METLLNTVYLGRYRMEELRGEGRNAIVYRAYDMVRRGDVALKLYSAESLDHQAAEAAEQHRLEECPSVMPLYEVHPSALPYEATAMPLAERSLAQAVPMPGPEVRQQVLRILNALRWCHGRGIVHGDVKPANCFLDRHGHVLLGDFGVADFLPDGRRGHTLEYAAPELLRGEPRSAATDVWATTVMLYELLCGNMPFGSTADDPPDVVAARISRATFPPVSTKRPFLPRRVQRLFESAFEVDPASRGIASAEVAHNELANARIDVDWVRLRGEDALERWEGVERDRDGELTGVTYVAELTSLPRARRFEADVRRGAPGGRPQRLARTRRCVDRSEARTRQCLYAKMRAITEGRRPS
jgi:serine/threonine protein kinase